ncbi:MAG: family 16 glycosylhydrolase [Rikenellaceae bacterium]
MKRTIIILSLAVMATLSVKAQDDPKKYLPEGKWSLVWSDEFDYEDKELDKKWESQNGPSGHIECSRWRENAVVKDGTLRLVNRKENRGGQNWTSGSIWTKEQFQYGYFECRYRYAAVQATNNSFWLMTRGADPAKGKRFEIDINEGHYPNEVNTNIHNWSDITVVNGKKTHPSKSNTFTYGVQPAYSLPLEIPITTKKLRFSSELASHFHIGEFRAYNVNEAGYPDPLSETADKDVAGLKNFVREEGVKFTSSGSYGDGANFAVKNIADGQIHNRWTAQKEGLKFFEVEFAEAKEIGCIQFLNGWHNKDHWAGLIAEYKIQYHNGKEWVDIVSKSAINSSLDLSKEFHVYGLEWNKKEFIFYFDGKEIRREKNEIAYSPSPIWLSLAIIKWAGPITDTLDGTQMEVDYVRVYKQKK